jgi:predicted DNA-binding transcriptional regulator AlpA
MNHLQLHLSITLGEQETQKLSKLIREAIFAEITNAGEAARLSASRLAVFAGQKPPEDKGLLIDTNQAAKLLNVCPRTIFRMERSGEMPKAFRLGKAVRWSMKELTHWVNSGCPKSVE